MDKVLYYKVPKSLKRFHYSVQGMKLVKGMWSNLDLAEYVNNHSFSLIVLDENSLKDYSKELSKLPRETKLVVLSNDLNVLERADGIINDNYELITKFTKINLESKAQGLYFWALGNQVVTRCIKCGYAQKGTHYSCDACGSYWVEVAQAENLL